MSRTKLQAVVLAMAIAATAGSAAAEQRSALKPSPDLFAADIDKLIADLKAAKASEDQLNAAQAMYDSAKAIGLAADLSPTMQSFIQASASHDAGTAKDLLEKMGPFELGEAAYVVHNYASAQKYWLEPAQAGNVGAQINIGLMYSSGSFGATQSDGEAFKWYRLASIQGNEVAQENLAVLYEEGRGVPKNLTQAYVWLSLAAQQAVNDGHRATSVALIKHRDKFAQELDAAALDRALKLVSQCQASQYKTCE